MLVWMTALLGAVGPLPIADDVAGELAHGVGTPLHDPSGRAMEAFHQALRRTERRETKARILQFGASHTAADLMTGYMRERLQARFGDGGHGFVMPARPWRTYRHQGIRYDNPRSKRRRWLWERVRLGGESREDGLYGLAGMAVTATNKRQWQKFETRGGTTASRIEVWYHRHPRGGDAYLQVDSRRPMRLRTRGHEGFGVFQTSFRDAPHRFFLRPRGNGSVRLYGAVLENSHPGVVVDTLGINGARAASMLSWNYELWRALVKRRDPSLIVLAYGTNEAGDADQPIEEYEESLRTVVDRVRRAAPRASCVLFGPTDRPILLDREQTKGKEDVDKTFLRRPRLFQVIDAQRRISAEHGCAFFDAVQATGGPFSIVTWADLEPRLAYRDYVHLTSRGYRVLSDLFVNALLDGFVSSRQEGGGR